jgi:ribosomal protein S18 acetylase RimI-like enzyme
MVDHLIRPADPVDAEHRSQFRLRDAPILKRAVRESILTSPDSFLKTVKDVDRMGPDYWDKEITNSTWVVIEQVDEVVGIAVARWPDQYVDLRIVPTNKARFIESVWIAPNFRGSRMAERLVNYLIEVECRKHPSVIRFKLWVFENNSQAIRLYERMLFKYVEKQALADRIELCYEYMLPRVSRRKAARRATVNMRAREDDKRQHGVTYRELRPDIACRNPR